MSAFSRIWTEYGDIHMEYSVRMRENADQNTTNKDTFQAVLIPISENLYMVLSPSIKNIYILID